MWVFCNVSDNAENFFFFFVPLVSKYVDRLMIDHWEAEFQMGYIIYIQAMQGSDFTLTLLISIIYIDRKSEMS